MQSLFEAGAQFGFSRSRRHPSMQPYVYAIKNRIEIIDLEKTADLLTQACNFVKSIGQKRQQILFVANKIEAMIIVREVAQRLAQPYAADRWLGGTLTNFGEMKKRIAKLLDLTQKRERQELGMYTKKERLLIDREIAHLDRFFGGLVGMTQMPGALFIVDPREEKTAIHEAKALHIPVIALAGTDCDVRPLAYPIVANDASRSSIRSIVAHIVTAYEAGMQLPAEGAAAIVTPQGVETLATAEVASS